MCCPLSDLPGGIWEHFVYPVLWFSALTFEVDDLAKVSDLLFLCYVICAKDFNALWQCPHL